MRFTTTVLRARKTATGLPVPESVIEALGSGKRPAVVVTINRGYTYRSTVGVMDEQFLVPLSAAHRAAARSSGRSTVRGRVSTSSDTSTVSPAAIPAAALQEAGVRAAFDALSNSRQRALADPVTQAKAPETRARRIEKAVESLRG
jgi:hypothetical protein